MRVRKQSLALAHDGVLRDFDGRWNKRMMPTSAVHLRKLRISRHEREVAGDVDGAAEFDDEISAVEAHERAIAEEQYWNDSKEARGRLEERICAEIRVPHSSRETPIKTDRAIAWDVLWTN
jgi:hypothetical protein